MGGLVDWLQRIAAHRLPPDERDQLAAFRAEIASQWEPHDSEQRALERRSQLVHLATSLTAGGVSLLSAGVGGLITTVGALVLAVAPPTTRSEYDSGVPLALALLLAAGILSLSVETLRFPRLIRPRFATVVGVPLGIGTLGSAATMQVVLVWDVVLFLGLIVGGIGCWAVCGGQLTHRPQIVRWGVAGVGVAAVGICISDGRWVGIYAADGDDLSAIGCALAAFGSFVMANGLLTARVDMRPAPS